MLLRKYGQLKGRQLSQTGLLVLLGGMVMNTISTLLSRITAGKAPAGLLPFVDPGARWLPFLAGFTLGLGMVLLGVAIVFLIRGMRDRCAE